MARLLLRDLTPGTNYKVQLRAADGDSVSEWSRLFDLAVMSDGVAPDVPAWSAGSDWVVSGDSFVAQWDAINPTLDQNKDFKHYEVSLSDGTTTKTTVTTNTSYTLSFEQNRKFFGTPKATVTAKVRAVDNNGNASAYNTQKSATNAAPAAPTNPLAGDGELAPPYILDTFTRADGPVNNSITDTGHKWLVDANSANISGNKALIGNTVNNGWHTMEFDQGVGYSSPVATTDAVTISLDVTHSQAQSNLWISPVTMVGSNWSVFVVSSDQSHFECYYRDGAGTINYLGVSVTLSSAMAVGTPKTIQVSYVRSTGVLSVYEGTVLAGSATVPSGVRSNLVGSSVPQMKVGNNSTQIYTFDNIKVFNSTANFVGAPSVAIAGTDQIALAWEPPAGETDIEKYNVYVGATSGFTPAAANRIYSGNSTRFTYTTVGYTTQYFKIRAVDKFGQESPDLTDNAAAASPFVVDTVAPAVPTALASTITNNASGIGARAAVSWTLSSPPTDLAGFYVRYRKVGDTNYSNAAFQKDDRAGTIELQSAYQNYEFQIKSYDWQNNESAWSATVTATSPSNAAPANVTGLVSTPGKDSITYSWTAVADTDIKNYEVTFSTSATFASGNTTFLTGTSTTLTVGGLTSGATYYARVRAVDTAGNTSAAWSATDTETTGTFAAPSPSDGQVPGTGTTPNVTGGLSYLYVTWAPVTLNVLGAAQNDTVTYEVHLSTTTGFTPSGATKVTEISGTSAIIDNLPGTTTPLSYGTTYFIKIVPKDRDGSGAASAQGSGTISKVASTDVTSIGADLIVPGTGFVNALVINSGGSVQSSDWTSLATGWKIGQLGIEINSSASKIKVDALQAGVIGGASGAGLIDVATGTSLRLNGGNVRSNTYNGAGNVYDANATAGFYLGNDGLVIAQGKVKAEALSGGTFNAGTINIAAGGAITGGAWSLSSTGLTIPNGGINAAHLNLQIGENIINPKWADFEYTTNSYPSSWPVNSSSGFTAALDLTQSKFNTASLKLVNTSAAVRIAYLGDTTTDYNTYAEPSTRYIISMHIYNAGGATVDVSPVVKQSSGTTITLAAQTIANTAAWVRYSWTVTTDASINSVLLGVRVVNSGTLYVDGVQWEVATNTTVTTASPWGPPSSTRIDGGQVRTGSVQSNQSASVWNSSTETFVTDTSIPAWSINTTGIAQFGELLVRGKIVVGNTSEASTALSTISSPNYVPGNEGSGWMIRSDGYAEFRNLASNIIGSEQLRADAVTASSIGSGELSSSLTLTGSMYAYGKYGERVGMSGEGFLVQGPKTLSYNITSRSITSNVATVTTSVVHQALVGDYITITGIDTTFDGEWLITAVTGTTISFATDAADLGATGSAGTGSVVNHSELVQGPTYVQFPSNGKQPNIIAGQIQATTLTISAGMTVTGSSLYEAGANIVLAGAVQAPKQPPALTYNWQNYDFVSDISSGSPAAAVYSWSKGLTSDGTKFYTSISQVLPRTAYDSPGVAIFDPVAGTDTYKSLTYTDGIARKPYGIVYMPATGYFAVLSNRSGTKPPLGWEISFFNPADVTNGPNEWKQVGSSTTVLNSELYVGMSPVMGWDHTGSRLMVGFWNSVNAFVRTWTVSSTTITASTSYNLGMIGNGAEEWGYISKGNFDSGADRIVVSYYDSNATAVYTCSTGSPIKSLTAERWDVRLSGTTGMWWDGTRFWSTKMLAPAVNSLSPGNINLTRYEGSQYWWTSGSSTWWLAYTWFDGQLMNITNKALTSNMATLTTSMPHGLNVTDTVVVSQVDSTFNGTYTVTSIPTPTTFVYSKVAGNVASTAVSGGYATTGGAQTTTVTTKALTSNVATLTLSAAHSFAVGDQIVVAGVDATFNGTYTITAVTSTTVSYAKTAANVTSVASGGNVLGGQHETTLGPSASITMRKRARLQVTTAPIPHGDFSINSPTAVNIYKGTGTTDPGAGKLKWATVMRPTEDTSPTTIMDGSVTPSGTPLTVAFPAVTNPGQIQSASGNSYWRGDDTAQFYQLILTSANDAGTLSGNKPALRIGDIAAGHLRIDGNEIVAMLNDTSQGTLFLNSGGNVRLGDASSDLIKGFSRGNTTKTTDANGEYTIAHGLSGTPAAVNVTTGTSHQLQVVTITGTNFTIRVRTAAGVLVGSGVTSQCIWTAWT